MTRVLGLRLRLLRWKGLPLGLFGSLPLLDSSLGLWSLLPIDWLMRLEMLLPGWVVEPRFLLSFDYWQWPEIPVPGWAEGLHFLLPLGYLRWLEIPVPGWAADLDLLLPLD